MSSVLWCGLITHSFVFMCHFLAPQLHLLLLSKFLAPSGALIVIAILTYSWSTTTTPFFRSHLSSTLDFHFLSHDSYIKAIMLYKGNHWTHPMATCIPYGYNRTSLQDSARWCKMVQDGARWCKMVQDGATWCKMVQHGSTWCNMVQDCATWCKMVQDSARWCKMVPDGARWCRMVQGGARWCKMVQGGSRWYKMVQDGARWCMMVQDGAR